MVNFGEKAKIKKAGNLNEGRSYVITTVCIHYNLLLKKFCIVVRYECIIGFFFLTYMMNFLCRLKSTKKNFRDKKGGWLTLK